jgi:HD-like signal output (HDOD) protein
MSRLIPSDKELKQAYQVIKGEQIPSVPDILVNLYGELEKSEPNTRRVSELVAKDQAITGQVLKSINSPHFALQQAVESISQAVVLLGIGEIRNLVTAAAFQSRMQATSPAARHIWHDSLNVAQVAMRIASRVVGITQDEAYLTGLLHDCGALLLAEKFPLYEQLISIENEHPVMLINKEIQYLGTSHAVIGYLFATHWKLPERTCQAIYLHHSLKCDAIEDARLRALIATLKVAHLLVKEKSLPEGSFSLERIQYLSYAKKELMLDNEFMDELRTVAILEME